jgi:glutaconate CoA-transferase subunit B
MIDMFGLYLQGGLVEVAFLGGAQIDRYGNLNTTVIGDYGQPKVRLPGSGGACEIAINAQRVFVTMRLKRRAFVERLDFVTSPGHLGGGGARAGLGIPGGGPELVVTDKCVFGFDVETKEMVLESLHPGVELAQIHSEVGWDLRVAPGLRKTEPPTVEELGLLREHLDPQRIYTR